MILSLRICRPVALTGLVAFVLIFFSAQFAAAGMMVCALKL